MLLARPSKSGTYGGPVVVFPLVHTSRKLCALISSAVRQLVIHRQRRALQSWHHARKALLGSQSKCAHNFIDISSAGFQPRAVVYFGDSEGLLNGSQ